jgi:5-methylcytosine-specific restriction endonuclease McrBC regulatory subunit McrC
MERLFESFVEKTLVHILNSISPDLTVRPQVSKIYATAFQHSGRSYFTRPDNVLYRNEKPVLLLDAKYKQFEHSETGTMKRPQNSDIYQLFASMVAHECDRGLLVYPRMLTHEEPTEGQIRLWRISTPAKPLLVGAITIKVHQLSTKATIDELDESVAKSINELLAYQF